jgi:hypothetical protein
VFTVTKLKVAAIRILSSGASDDRSRPLFVTSVIKPAGRLFATNSTTHARFFLSARSSAAAFRFLVPVYPRNPALYTTPLSLSLAALFA